MKTPTLFILLTLLLSGNIFLFSQGQITAPPGTAQIPSDYVDPTIPDDPVYIFCSPDQNGDSILGTLSVMGGSANCTYIWGIYNPDPFSLFYQQFVPFLTGPIPTGPSSTLTDLDSGFYQVIITCNTGLPSETSECRRAHVFINKTNLDFDNISPGCSSFNITGASIDALDNFTIYDPPQTPFIIDSTTTIEVCFWANHSFVSDLGFYLYSPTGERIDLLPPVSAWDQGTQVTELLIGDVIGCNPSEWYTNCNSGNNIENFCFTTSLPAGNPNLTPCICDMTTPLSGTYASADDWSDLYGINTSESGWAVSVFDCFPADNGLLQRVTLSFTGSSYIGTSNYTYDSGPINIIINDGACDSTTATIYYLPSNTYESHVITNEVTAEWSCFPILWDPAWGSQNYLINPQPYINPPPLASTTFCLTVFDHLFDTSGVEITNYVPCEPVVCSLFETLPTDPTIINPPIELCSNSPPVQLTPLYWGGSWSSTCGSCLTAGGVFFPDLAYPGPVDVTYSWGGVCSSDTTITISVLPLVEVSNIVEICNSQNTHFQVCFNMISGNPGAYSIIDNFTGLPFGGSFSGSQWCSNWIPTGTSYSITATDNNNCDPQLITGFHTCVCISEAGDMPGNIIEVCANSPAFATVLFDTLGNPTYTLDGNDGFEYFMHSDSTYNLGTVISHNTTGDFLFQPPMVYGQTYYISQVVGNNIGTSTNHIVDLNDPCLSVATGTPVVWYESPIVNAGSDKFICGTETYLDAINSTGNGHWLPSQAQILDIIDPNSMAHFGLTGTNDSVQFVWEEYSQYGSFQCISTDTVIIVFMIIPQAEVFWSPYVSLDYICGSTETDNENIFVAETPGITGNNVISYWIGDDAIFYPNVYEENPDSVVVLSFGYHEMNWVIENHHMDSVCSDTSITILVNFISILTSATITNLTNAISPNGAIDLYVSGGELPYTYSWSNGETTEDLTNLSEGVYLVTVTDVNGCFTIDSVQINNLISITEIPDSNTDNIILFPNIPNPFSFETEFRFFLHEKSPVKFSIYDLIGNEIDVLISEDMNKGNHQIRYNKILPVGTYFYRLTTNNDSKTMKMVIIEP